MTYRAPVGNNIMMIAIKRLLLVFSLAMTSCICPSQQQKSLPEQLVKAIEDNNLGQIASLINKPMNINAGVGVYLKTPLSAAINAANLSLVLELIEKKADVNKRGFGGKSPLCEAARINNKLLIECLIDGRADVTRVDDENRTILFYVDKNLDKSMLHWLLAKKIDINHKDPEGETALSKAVKNGQHGLVENFLMCSAILDSKSIGRLAQNVVVNDGGAPESKDEEVSKDKKECAYIRRCIIVSMLPFPKVVTDILCNYLA